MAIRRKNPKPLDVDKVQQAQAKAQTGPPGITSMGSGGGSNVFSGSIYASGVLDSTVIQGVRDPDDETLFYQIVVLRDDQLDLIANKILEKIDKRVDELVNAKFSYLDDDE